MDNIKNSKHIEITLNGNGRFTKRKKLALIIVVSIIAFLLSAIIFVWVCVTGGFPTKTSDIKDYGIFKDFKGYSNLYIFPTQMPESARIEAYNYYYRNTFFDPTCQIYLEYSLSKVDFDAEILRLSKISEKYENENYKGIENRIVYDTKNFIYPAYVTIFNNNNCYEYALLNKGECKIICVFTQFIGYNDIKFNKKYLPIDFKNQKNSRGFNIYYSYSENGDGYFERHKR